ncbi:TFIIH basal transcription factor subunit [Leishmania donovani]|uniref:General transcription factor IIH subunit 4 n=3 Tax=Leishmania donovani species complex TaxID=38574 RepID=A0A6L0Y1G7_LEIIN|nr:conserved hypothetical protein [Leishmania infantum JPCM5]CAC9549119.1 TFIIH_basal_transcription_factor_subunit_-_putative [Leishmania infantum]CAJ1993445.1 TFIIH basal transcription factor subunit [Leishmania donovani]CAM72632.1 conserved hypothetical protein [Leishmania infantum JPCM5]SUZ46457.1 TFIIH_basal_transcription_factor_subunit_-_putative [Leishmania infantum]VDZ49271.1 TFIIH_basal_transcription_factor_subunit_putative/GeneDB:LmjF.36.0800 [Leishmania donovani]|eukprot:XP_001469523.1 conserved hypothetical protein [Leishmania infantum JPCM5]
MPSSSSALDVPLVEVICSYPTREGLCAECPALLLLVYQHVVAELQAGRRAVDVFRGTSRQDHLSELLGVRSLSELFEHLYPLSQSCTLDESTAGSQFWRQARATLEAAWAPPHDAKARALLTQVRGQPRFRFCGPRDAETPGEGYPLHPVSLERALATSKRFLRTAMTCALDGSTDALAGRQPELRAVLQLAHLVPHTPSTGAPPRKEVTPEGISFCMVSLQQRWWVLVNAALERVLLLTRAAANGNGNTSGSSGVTKSLLWQLLAVLSVLDTAHYVFAFPERQQDLAAHHLLARLSEVGLVYPLLSNDRKCFVLSPDFLHAIHWHASTPLSLTFNHHLLRSVSGVSDIRREDTDTIITETNFRLYAYTDDADLLNILNQFAKLEEIVNGNLHCYRVTRDSFASAMRKGITAAQVLRFLSLRAHPSMLRRHGEREENGDTTSPSSAGGASSSFTFSASPRRRAVAGTCGSTTSIDAVSTLVVPQSFCDQMHMWESECRRVVFEHHVVLLRNMSTEQQKAVTAYLIDAGEVDAVAHAERGYMVIREEVFERLVAPLLR